MSRVINHLAEIRKRLLWNHCFCCCNFTPPTPLACFLLAFTLKYPTHLVDELLFFLNNRVHRNDQIFKKPRAGKTLYYIRFIIICFPLFKTNGTRLVSVTISHVSSGGANPQKQLIGRIIRSKSRACARHFEHKLPITRLIIIYNVCNQQCLFFLYD